MKVLLVSTPFILHTIAPAGIGALKGALNAKGYCCDILYLSLRLAALMGNDDYYYFAKNYWPAEFLYAPYAFPSHPNKAKIKRCYKEWLATHRAEPISKRLSNYESALKLLKRFHRDALSDLLKKRYDLVGFSITHNELLASVYFAKCYKAKYPTSKIVFGGEQCTGEIGASYLHAFDWLDYVVHGEGEDTLIDVIDHMGTHDDRPIAGCSYRNGERIIEGPPRSPVGSLDALPIPDHSDYFKNVGRYKSIFPSLNIPIEFTRGCWWDSCSFCSHGFSHKRYRRFSPKRIRKTMERFSDEYRELQYVCADIVEYRPVRELTEELSKSQKQFEIFMETHVTLQPEELAALKKAGLKYNQFGIESLSTSLLKKMNKGTTAIQSIQAVKCSKILELDTRFNLITGYPGETKKEFGECVNNLKTTWHLFHGFIESGFSLEYGSPMYFKPQKYGLTRLRPLKYYRVMLPKEYYDKFAFTMWNFDTARPRLGSYREAIAHKGWYGYPNPQLTYLDGGSFLQIFDDRYADAQEEFRVDGLTREIYLFCATIKRFEDIRKRFGKEHTEKVLRKELRDLCRATIMFREGDHYLSLALPTRNVSTSKHSD